MFPSTPCSDRTWHYPMFPCSKLLSGTLFGPAMLFSQRVFQNIRLPLKNPR